MQIGEVIEAARAKSSSLPEETPDCDTEEEAVDMGGALGWQCVGTEADGHVEYRTATTSARRQRNAPASLSSSPAAPARSGCRDLADAADSAFAEIGMPFTDIHISSGDGCSVSGYVKACLDGICYDPYAACPQIESGLRQGIYSVISEYAISAPVAIAEEPDKCLVILFL